MPVLKIKDIPIIEEVIEEPISNKLSKRTIEEEWSTDSDSNSTAPELEVTNLLLMIIQMEKFL